MALEPHDGSTGGEPAAPLDDSAPARAPDLRPVDQDVLCPVCRYNLRGLQGDVVTCPECGQSCDVRAALTPAEKPDLQWASPDRFREVQQRARAKAAARKAGGSDLAAATVDPVEAIQRDLCCPGCEYNLRGLTGPVVTCPECGLKSELARLIIHRWQQSIFRVPYYMEAARPVGWAAAIPIVAIYALLLVDITQFEISAGLVAVMAMTLILLLAGWVRRLRRVVDIFGLQEATWISLAMHGLCLTYLVTLGGLVIVGFNLLYHVGSAWGRPAALLSQAGAVGLIVGLLAMFFVTRGGDRWIARRCLRQYLADQVAGIGPARTPAS